MKKALGLILVMLVIFTGCQMKNYTPEIPLTLDENVKVISGDYSYTCKIRKSESNEVQAEITSTSAKGLVMQYDGSTLDFTYCDYSYSIDAENFERKNPAIVVYEVFECVNSPDSAKGFKTDNGYKYEGKISLGNFTLYLRDDSSVSLITVKSAGFVMEFTD